MFAAFHVRCRRPQRPGDLCGLDVNEDVLVSLCILFIISSS